MALEPVAVEALLEECADGKPRRLLSLGYPDILAYKGQFEGVPERPDADQIRAWHNWTGRVPDTDAAFASINVRPFYFDYAKVRGPEIVCDLNEPPEDAGTYDIILDPGTSEHIFNIGAVFAFIARSVRIKGIVLHTNPLNMGNHGFWSINPTAYKDWYEANGFSGVGFAILTGPVADRTMVRLEATKRFDAPPNSTVLCVVRRELDTYLQWPVQSKYRLNPTLKGAA